MNQNLMEFTLDIIYLKKYGAYTINCDEFSDIGTHWIALYVLNNNVTFCSCDVENISKVV